MFTNARQVTIEWGDCDPAGIVYYPRYFAMFDTSTARLFEAALGMSKREMLKTYGIIGFPMVETSAKFGAPSRFGDVVHIKSRITRIGRASFNVAHILHHADGVAAIEASETRVWAIADPNDAERIKGETIPQSVITALSQTTP